MEQNNNSSSSSFYDPNFSLKIEGLSKSSISLIRKIVKPNKKYFQIKINSNIYEIGDFLLMRAKENEFYAGKLIEIRPINGLKEVPYWPSIVLQIYVFRDDIDKESNGLNDEDAFDSISNYEVFETDELYTDYSENILSLAKLMSFEEYEVNDQHSFNSFFTRAKYDMNTHLLTPPMSEWEKACICNNPMNPDQLYISCDECGKWYHPKHCGVKEEDANNIPSFICSFCKGNSNNKSN